MTFALFVVPVVLLLIGFPIFMVLLTAVTVALVFVMNVPLMVIHQNLFGSVNATPLLAVPFFIYAGELMGRGSVAQRLVDFVQGGVGSVRGSLGVTTVTAGAEKMADYRAKARGELDAWTRDKRKKTA